MSGLNTLATVACCLWLHAVESAQSTLVRVRTLLTWGTLKRLLSRILMSRPDTVDSVDQLQQTLEQALHLESIHDPATASTRYLESTDFEGLMNGYIQSAAAMCNALCAAFSSPPRTFRPQSTHLMGASFFGPKLEMYHANIVSGRLPPRFYIHRMGNTSFGWGNLAHHISASFLYALATECSSIHASLERRATLRRLFYLGNRRHFVLSLNGCTLSRRAFLLDSSEAFHFDLHKFLGKPGFNWRYDEVVSANAAFESLFQMSTSFDHPGKPL